jgi:tetratricopeptide (TPR) repeat protein
LSQDDLSGPGLSASYVSLIEAGKRNPTVRAVQLLAERLGTSPRYLTEGVEDDAAREQRLQLHYAELALRSGEAVEAQHVFVEVSERACDPEIRQAAAWGLARSYELQGQLETAIAAYERIREGGLPGGDDRALELLIALIRCYREAGALGRSIDIGETALDELLRQGLLGTDLEVQLACTLSTAYYERGDLARARYLMTEAIARAERSGSPRARGSAYWNASIYAQEAGRLDEALRHAQRAVALFGEADDLRNLGRLHIAQAGLLLRSDPPQLEVALELLDRAANQLEESGSPIDLAYCETESARAHLLLGRPHEAIEIATRALDRVGPQPRLERVRAKSVLVQAQLAAGRTASALRGVSNLFDELTPFGLVRNTAELWREFADVLQSVGETDQALLAYRNATAAAGIPSSSTPPVSTQAGSAARRRGQVHRRGTHSL